MAADLNLMEKLTERLPTKSAKIRKLGAAGFARADIARFLGIRYQHVRNVLVASQAGKARDEPGNRQLQAPLRERLQLGPGGRVVIPAPMREAMKLEEGGTILAELVDGELRLITPEKALMRAQAIVRRCGSEADDMVDALIAERRMEERDRGGDD